MSTRDVALLAGIGALGAAAYLVARPRTSSAPASALYFFAPDQTANSGELVSEPPGAEPFYTASGDAAELVSEPPGASPLAVLEEAAAAVTEVVNGAAFMLTGSKLTKDTAWLIAAAKPENAPSVEAARAAEQRYGMPPLMLVRQMWQESRYNPKAYNARSGASGIMQIIPKWHPQADVWEPLNAINYGAGYDALMFGRFGSWELALQAYNWGPSSLKTHLAKLDRGEVSFLPSETRRYAAEILTDAAAAGVA